MGLEQTWEHFFPDAILSVEELLASGDPELLQKSKLNIALENSFLSWTDYKNWASNFYGVPVLENLDEKSILQLQKKHLEFAEGYNQHPFLNSELLPLQSWDGHLLVAGLEYTEQVTQLPQVIFVLCSLENLAFISNAPLRKKTPSQKIVEANKPLPSHLNMASESGLTGHHVWQNLETHHNDFSDIARKSFDAYVVLRVTAKQKTELYKMDEDLEKEKLDTALFSYDLSAENPFANVYKNHFTETFNINQLGLKILDFKYACISAIKLGPKVVGFLVGFKTTHLSQDDITTLESISEKAV